MKRNSTGFREMNERALILLKAAYEILNECDQSEFVISPMEVTVNYDEAECDGHCLMEDIENYLESMNNTQDTQG